MYGAILGDIIGSRFEFDRPGWTKDFELFAEGCQYTDDTVMTIAVADALIVAGKNATVEQIEQSVISAMKDWGYRFPEAGYGGRFFRWLLSTKKPEPYGSYGNGSAMRVSAAGFLYDSLERTREVARATANVTHNHPEGLKGAECTAAVIFMARNGSSKEEIKAYVDQEFGYDLSKSLDELRPLHEHVETCQDSLPKALTAFFEGESFEEVIRNAVSLGGDTDTLAAIAGSMAEAFYGIPVKLLVEGKKYLPKEMLEMAKIYDKVLGKNSDGLGEDGDAYANNRYIKMAVEQLYKTGGREQLAIVLSVLQDRVKENGEAPTPLIDSGHVFDSIDKKSVEEGNVIPFDEKMQFTIDTIRDEEGNEWIPLFTDCEEISKGNCSNIQMNIGIRFLMEQAVRSEHMSGVLINPFGEALPVPKDVLSAILESKDCK